MSKAATSKTPMSHALSTARRVTQIAYVIALIGIVGSYGTQVDLLLHYGAEKWFAWVAPATVDLLAIASALALQLPGLDKLSRWSAGLILLVATSVSGTANATGAPNTVMAVAHVWPVAAYLFGEFLANRVRAYAARVAEAEARARDAEAAAKIVAVPNDAAELESKDLPEAPVSPGPVGQNSKAGRKSIPATVGPNGRMVHAVTGEPLKTRTEQRKRTGK